jgi:hypothetical protein
VVLGVSPALIERLDRASLLADAQAGGVHPIARSRFVLGYQGMAAVSGTASWKGLSAVEWADRLVLPDPRHDRGWADALVAAFQDREFARTYSEILGLFANARSLETNSRACLARMRRDGGSGAAFCPEHAAIAGQLQYESVTPPNGVLQRGALLSRGVGRADAAAVLTAAAAWDRVVDPKGKFDVAVPEVAESSQRDVVADELLRDLLICTCAVAQPELRAAAAAVRRHWKSRPEAAARARGFMVEPPPWPPASVQALRERPSGPALVDALAAELAVDAGPARPLLEAWSEPPRAMGASELWAIAACDGGRIARGAVFRAWLTAEWTAWARQRFRRVARLAAGEAMS